MSKKMSANKQTVNLETIPKYAPTPLGHSGSPNFVVSCLNCGLRYQDRRKLYGAPEGTKILRVKYQHSLTS